MVGLLLALSVALLSAEWGAWSVRLFPGWCKLLALGIILLPLVPLPAGVVGALCPERALLAQSFPIESGHPSTWLSFGLCVGGALQRLWELSLVATFFCLARLGMARPAFPLHLAGVLTGTVAVLALSDVWLRYHGGKSIMGIWEVQCAYAAGTFANRNHFANYIYMASLFLFGWLIRNAQPLHAARTILYGGKKRSPLRFVTIFGTLIFGLAMAALSGSRGGFIAFGVGLVVWGAFLSLRSHSHKRWLGVGISLFLLVLALVSASSLLFDRLATVRSQFPFKVEIWKQAVQMTAHFPLFGTGLGSFVSVFSHYKQMEGERMIWHVENDWLQLLVETGAVGGLFFGVCLGWLLWRVIGFALKETMPEPELCFGALAGLTVFAFHALFEFVFQIPANAILAAVLLGVLVGMRDQPCRPALPLPPANWRVAVNFAWAGVLTLVAVLQGVAFWHWQSAQQVRAPAAFVAEARKAREWWPLDSRREVGLARGEVELFASQNRSVQRASAGASRERLNHALCLDPMNWELRLERTWLDLAFSTNAVRARQEAFEVVRLNPLETRICLRFARHFARRDPLTSMEFLRRLDLTKPDLLRPALEIAWLGDSRPSVLWSLTPDTPGTLKVLGDFAAERGLNTQAAQAYQMLVGREDRLELAKKFLRIKMPEAALNLLPLPSNNLNVRLVQIQALYELRQYADTIRQAEVFWAGSQVRKRLQARFPIAQNEEDLPPLEALLSAWRASPDNESLAQRLAERAYLQPVKSRDSALFQELAARFPNQPRFLWLAYQTERDQNKLAGAARLAVQLAERLIIWAG